MINQMYYFSRDYGLKNDLKNKKEGFITSCKESLSGLIVDTSFRGL